jgi:hypothetical protein
MMGNKIDLTQTNACNSKLTSQHVFLHKINNFLYVYLYFFLIPSLVADIQTWSLDGWRVQRTYVWSRTYYTDGLRVVSHTRHLSTISVHSLTVLNNHLKLNV